MTMSLIDWPKQQRPRERLLELGPAALSDAELLAIFLRVGTPGKSVMQLAMELLQRFGSLEKLCSAVQREPSLGSGLGPAKCAQLSASLELAKRAIHGDLKQASALNSTRVVGEYLKLTFFGKEHECFVALFLNMRNHLLGTEELFRGTLNHTTVYPREVIKMALRYNAASVIVAHNHPSGDPRPSDADLSLTKTLKKALEVIDVELLDHIVVAGTRLYSFADHGKV
ncbi:DNA repair protein RadC [Herbaspirillum sp. C9C3]|uniref:RadC family protein n=1 Tax=Herbaspirillum sp. C9C3 TaxID=2735271 RepID=UPI0015849A40|nr:DNA repair protein RadC [Herbaspirillum sp. C9C3]NUT63062.1 DNA repair protein RadC [Herbaspirillum sp. C9C3]